MIQFEEISEEQRAMLRAVHSVLDRFRNASTDKDSGSGGAAGEGGTPPSAADLLKNLMTGELGPYLGQLFAASDSGIPIKIDALRLIALHGAGEVEATAGGDLPKAMVTNRPARYGLTAMGLAAISSGKGGMALLMNKYLPELMKGRTFCYCITEPGAGTNTHKISTVAVDEGDHFRLSGQKTFISAADESHYMVVIARIESEGEPQGIGTFVVEAATEGISMTALDIAVLGDAQFSVYFDDVRIPKDALVGEKASRAGRSGQISGSVFYTLNLERIMIALIALIVGREALCKAVERARRPTRAAGSKASEQATKLKLAKAKLRHELAGLATKRATQEYDRKGTPQVAGMYANMAKLVATEAAVEACDAALAVYGVDGLDKSSSIGPLYQIARMFRVAPINNEMVLNFLGEHLLGLPKSYR